MKTIIGETAGRIWEMLRTKEKVNLARLPKLLKEQDVITYQAVGWLAREDKIEYTEARKQVYILLTPCEKDVDKE